MTITEISEALNIGLPAASVGSSKRYLLTDDVVVTLIPDGTDYFLLPNGTNAGPGQRIQSAAAKGCFIELLGLSGGRWLINVMRGSWTLA